MADFAQFVVGKIRDADTIEDEAGVPVRVLGIDAPESGTPAGEASTDFAKDVIKKRGVEVAKTGEKGYYGRDLGEVKLSGSETGFGEFMIRSGHARPVGGSEFDERNNLAESGSTAARVLGIQDRTPDNQYDIDLLGNVATDLKSPGGTFKRALARGADQVQQLGYSASNVAAMALGDLVGTETLDTWGEEGLRRNMVEAAMNPAKIESWDNVEDLNTFFTYAVEALGEQAPNIATMIGSGGILTVAKAGVSSVVKAQIGKKLQQLALKQGNDVRIGALRAQLKPKPQRFSNTTQGVAATSFTLGTGEIGNELREAGIDSPLTALVGAVPFAALDTIGFQATIGRLFRGIDKDIATQSVKDIAKNVFKAAGAGAGAESSTEMLQEVITLSARAFHDPTFEIFSEQNLKRIKEAGIKAGLVGGVLGGGSTIATSAVGKLSQPRDEAVPGETPVETGGVVDEDAGQPPPPPGGGVTTFNQRDTDYGYIDPESTVAANEIFEGAPEDQVASIRGVLEEQIEPQMLAVESKINAHEALRRCLAS